MLWKMRVVLAGLLLLACLGCGGEDPDEASFAIYHLETAIGRPGDEGELRCGPPRISCPGIVEQPPPREYRYAVTGEPALSGAHIDPSTVARATDPATGAAVVTVALTADGTAAFARVSKEAARTGGRDQAWHHLALVVGDEIVAFPQVDYDEFPDGITQAPSIQLTAVSEADARDLVRRLRCDG
jgi:hypothetical protein